jgi:predicted lipoprotein with Yx(FWY)xxD motif
LRAPEDARPAGKWSIYLREDGSRQWAYDGELLYTSIKDKVPGEINGSEPPSTVVASYYWTLALAPLVGVPAGIGVEKTVVGLALASRTSKTLYYPDRDDLATNSNAWQPLAAPVLASADKLPDWSIVTRIDGSRQWAYKGRPLYTYVHDVSSNAGLFGDIFGDPYGQRLEGWHVALLKEAPAHPAEVTIRTVVESNEDYPKLTTKRIYANVKGMTLYTIHCNEDTADHLACDDVGDSPRYWLRFCGGEEPCEKTWSPLLAPVGAKSIDDIWSVIVIDPRHPWKAADRMTHGLSVWAYRGRPVFTYVQDFRPGDEHGPGDSEDGVDTMFARILLAYEAPYRP